jgi:CubicO group peptidase (beta-lactamase class C family)
LKIPQFCAVLLMLGLAGSRRSAQSATDAAVSAKVDSVVEAQQKAQKIPGVSLAVCRDGKVIKASGYGLANVELDVPVTPETIFQTGSVGKQFTAMAVMMLVEEGKLQLDDRMTKYIPESPSSWKDVTIRQLLTHTSGIADYGGEEGTMGKGVINFRKDYTEDGLIQAFAKMPMDFPSGEKWSYSNTGYVLLGIIIHRVTGGFYGDFLQERIFRPLGMTSTRIISEAEIVPHRSSGYRLVKGELKNHEWVSPTLNATADGALYTNVLDLAKWDAARYSTKLVQQSSFDQMWSPVKLNNGKSVSLRIWLGRGQPGRSSGGSSRRSLAGVHDEHRPVSRRSPDGYRHDQSRFRQCEAGGNREGGCRSIPEVAFAQNRKVPAADDGRYKTWQPRLGIRLGAI